MYKHIFGPVPSRRLGISLGIDIIPHKTCTLNCVYCECGHTTNLTTERKEYIPTKEIIEEVKHYFSNNPEPDYITFSGSGEPTLNIKSKEIIDFLKSSYPKVPVAVLTNGTLFYDSEVRKSLLLADLVVPSLDAATLKTFLRIDRPEKSINLEDYINGLVKFRQEYKNKIWLEVFILPGYNDNLEDITALKEAIKKINPDLIQLNSMDRPGCLTNLEVASIETLNKIIEICGFDNVEIISKSKAREEIKSYRKDVEGHIIETIARRPSPVENIAEITGYHLSELMKYIHTLESQGKITSTLLNDKVFYKIK